MVVALIATLYFWSAGLNGAPRFTKEPEGYYNLQTKAFLHGQLHLPVEPNPALLALPDPYDPTANAPYRLHDMTLWKGRYYLYFGVAPVFLVFLPFRIVTGYYLSEPMAVALLTSLGFVMSAAVLSGLRRYWFQSTPSLVFLSLVSTLGLASPTLYLNQQPQFYQVPIACGYALSMAGLFCLVRYLVAVTCGRDWWLALAGSCFGLTLAARPNYILAMPLLVLPVWWCLRDKGGWRAPWRVWVRPMGLAFGPVAAVGLSLLAYNWARFDDPFEFGMRYQLAGQSFLNFTPLALKNLGPHLGQYLWKPVWWQPNFPFLEVVPESPFGVARHLAVIWLGILVFLPWCRNDMDSHNGWIVICGFSAGLGLANLTMNSLFFFNPMLRYVADFAPALVLTGVVGGMSLNRSPRLGRWTVIPVLACMFGSVGVSLAVFVQRLPEASQPVAVGRWMDAVTAQLLERLGYDYGPVQLEVELPVSPAARTEPLLQTGYTSDRRNWLQVEYLDDNRVRFGFFHAGLGVIRGRAIDIPPDRRLLVELECGALLPHVTHPLFSGWSISEIKDAQRRLIVRINGAEVLTAALRCYPSRPWDLQIGLSGFEGDQTRARFSGRVLAITRATVAPTAPPDPSVDTNGGPLRLAIQFPALGHGFEPLVSVGERGDGELLYIIYGPRHTLQLAVDSLGQGAVYSRPMPYDPTVTHNLTVWIGAWAGQTDEVERQSDLSRRLFVQLDERVVFDMDRPFRARSGTMAVLGLNNIGSGAAGAEFTGRLRSVEKLPIKALPIRQDAGRYGAVDMRVKFPVTAFGRAEPLVCTGEPGAGNIVYVRYLDTNHIQFGLDHWGKGGVSTAPIPINYSEVHRLEISMGSLYPAQTRGWSRRLFLRLNGRVLLDLDTDFHASNPRQVQIGVNSIGGSTCQPQFTGDIRKIERPQFLE